MSDELLRRLRREHRQNPDDAAARDRYMAELERVVGLAAKSTIRVRLEDRSLPCLLCEKSVELETIPGEEPTAAAIVQSNFDRGAHSKHGWTYGNYGCQVIDMSGVLHFVICDGCIIRHSGKMLYVPSLPVKDVEGRYVWEATPGGGGHVKHEDGPIEVARDHYEKWFEWLKKKYASEPDDEYMKDVAPHFED